MVNRDNEVNQVVTLSDCRKVSIAKHPDRDTPDAAEIV